MEGQTRVSDVVIKRLPLYYRHLSELEAQGVTRVSSKELAAQMGLTASQIRQDIGLFGTFGQQGVGYHVSQLKSHIGSILGIGEGYHVIVLGAGNIGQALAHYSNFEHYGFSIRALFDCDPKLVGKTVCGREVRDSADLAAYLSENKVDIGVICVPKEAAQAAADRLVRGNVRAIWNFAPVKLEIPEHVFINNVHLTDSLLELSYRLSRQNAE